MTPRELAAKWRTQADEQMRLAKNVRCHSMDQVKMGYLRAATAFLDCASELETLEETREGSEARAQGSDTSIG